MWLRKDATSNAKDAAYDVGKNYIDLLLDAQEVIPLNRTVSQRSRGELSPLVLGGLAMLKRKRK